MFCSKESVSFASIDDRHTAHDVLLFCVKLRHLIVQIAHM